MLSGNMVRTVRKGALLESGHGRRGTETRFEIFGSEEGSKDTPLPFLEA